MKALIVFVCLTFCQLTWAKDTLVAGLFNIVPYAYEHNDKIEGITPEIIKSIQKEADIEIKMLFLPYGRMLKYLKSGQIDFAIFFLSDYSASFSEKLLPMYDLKTIVIGKKGLRISSNENLFKLSLATPLGVNYNTGLSNSGDISMNYVQDYANAIRMLQKGNVDAIVAPQNILAYQLKRMGMSIKDFGEPFYLTTNTAWVQFSDKSKKHEYKGVLKKAAKKLLDEGRVQSIIERYYPKNEY